MIRLVRTGARPQDFSFHVCRVLSLPQVNEGGTGPRLRSAAVSHVAPSSQGMAKVQDGHQNTCDRYAASPPPPRSVALLLRGRSRLAVCRSSAMLEESQDGMDSGTLSPASARQVTIQRHPTQGFGFIAGSQRPVIVRSVSAG